MTDVIIMQFLILLDLHYNSFHWFTFNVADIFITMGVLAFIAREFFVRNKI